MSVKRAIAEETAFTLSPLPARIGYHYLNLPAVMILYIKWFDYLKTKSS